MIFTDKYSPTKINEIVGNGESILYLKDYILNYKKQKKNCALVYGPPGSGKTCSIYAIAKENSLEILEINASDVRNKNGINEIIGSSINQASLFNKGKVILLDEIDGLSGTKDRGGIQAITALIAKSQFPIIFTANDPWSSKLSSLRKKSELIELKKLSYLEVFDILKKIAINEKIEVEDAILKRISSFSGGDSRSAINDLQTVSSGKQKITIEELEILGDRERENEIKDALNAILKGNERLAANSLNNINVNFDESILWIEENIPNVYKNPKDLAGAFSFLSLADLFRGRIRRQQHWRFLVYQNIFMSSGVASARTEKPNSFFDYKRSSRILKLWIAKMRYGKKKAIAEKIAEKTHVSRKRAMESLSYLKVALKNDDLLRERLDIGEGDLKNIIS